MRARNISATDRLLSESEFAALKQLSKSFARGTISEQISGRLVSLGYARDFMSNLVITDEGLSRLTLGRGDGASR